MNIMIALPRINIIRSTTDLQSFQWMRQKL